MWAMPYRPGLALAIVLAAAPLARAGNMCADKIEAEGEDDAQIFFSSTCFDVRYDVVDPGAGVLYSAPTLVSEMTRADWPADRFEGDLSGRMGTMDDRLEAFVKGLRAALTPLAAEPAVKLPCAYPVERGKMAWTAACEIDLPGAAGHLACAMRRARSPWQATCTLTISGGRADVTVTGAHGPSRARVFHSAHHPDVALVVLSFPDENHKTLAWDHLLVAPAPRALALGKAAFAAKLPAALRKRFLGLATWKKEP
jgi:hypothetical protein